MQKNENERKDYGWVYAYSGVIVLVELAGILEGFFNGINGSNHCFLLQWEYGLVPANYILSSQFSEALDFEELKIFFGELLLEIGW